jgi:hypothetical protein
MTNDPTSAPTDSPNVCSSCGCFRNYPITNPGDLCAECRKSLAPLQFQAFYLCRSLCGDMDEHSIALRVPLMMQAYVLGARHKPNDVEINVPHLWSKIPTIDAPAGLPHTWYCLSCRKQTTTDGAEPPDALAGECCQRLPAADVATSWWQANRRIGELSEMLFDVVRNHAAKGQPTRQTPHGTRSDEIAETLALALSNQKLRSDLQAASERIAQLEGSRATTDRPPRTPDIPGGKIVFVAGHDFYNDGTPSPPPAMLELCPNGDIFVNGRLAANDKEVVETLREFTLRLDTGLRDALAQLVAAAELDADPSHGVSIAELRQLLDGHASKAAERVRQAALSVLDEVCDRLLLAKGPMSLAVVRRLRAEVRDGTFVVPTLSRQGDPAPDPEPPDSQSETR